TQAAQARPGNSQARQRVTRAENPDWADERRHGCDITVAPYQRVPRKFRGWAPWRGRQPLPVGPGRVTGKAGSRKNGGIVSHAPHECQEKKRRKPSLRVAPRGPRFGAPSFKVAAAWHTQRRRSGHDLRPLHTLCTHSRIHASLLPLLALAGAHAPHFSHD